MSNSKMALLIALCAACQGTHGQDGTDASMTTDSPVSAGVCPDGLPLGNLANKPTFAVTINGQGPYTFVYDTGAPGSVIDTAVRAQVGAGPYMVGVGGRMLAASSIPDDNIAQTFGIPGAQGIIGTDLLGQYVVTIDRQRQRMWIDTALDEAALAACTHVSSTVTHADFTLADYLYVQGKLEGVDGWFLVDTGATLGAIPQSVLDQLQSEHPRPALTGFYTPAGIGTFWAELATVGSMQVGSMTVQHLAVRTTPEGLLPPSPMAPFNGLLPDGFLHHALMTVDYPDHQIRWAPYVGDSLTEPTYAYSTGIGLANEMTTPPHVATVLANSSAAAQGVVVGDVVLQVGGTAIASIPLASRPWSLASMAPNAAISVQVRGTAGTRTLSLTTADLLTGP